MVIYISYTFNKLLEWIRGFKEISKLKLMIRISKTILSINNSDFIIIVIILITDEYINPFFYYIF